MPNLIFSVGRRGMKTNNPLNNDIGIWMCCASQTIQNQAQKDAKHSQMPSLCFSSHSNSSGLKPLTENKLVTTAAIWLSFLTPAALLHLSPMPVCNSLDLFFGYFKSIRSLRDECEEACVKKDLVWQGLRVQTMVCSVLLCCGCACQTSVPPSSEAAGAVAYTGSQEKSEKSIGKPHEIRAAGAALQ